MSLPVNCRVGSGSKWICGRLCSVRRLGVVVGLLLLQWLWRWCCVVGVVVVASVAVIALMVDACDNDASIWGNSTWLASLGDLLQFRGIFLVNICKWPRHLVNGGYHLNSNSIYFRLFNSPLKNISPHSKSCLYRVELI